MAQIDARIPLGAIAPQFDNIQEIQARGMQMQQLGRQQQEQDRALSEQTALRDLYKRATGTDGKIDNTALMTGLAQIGQGERIPAVQKGILDQHKTQTEADTADYGLLLKKINSVRNVLGASLADPNLSHDTVIRNLTAAVQRGEIEPEMGAEVARNLPGRPEQLRPYLMQQDLEGLDHAKRIEMLQPKIEYKDQGNQLTPVDTNPMTNPNPQALVKQQSPDSIATNQRLAANAARAAEAGFTDAEGSLMGALAEAGVQLPAGLRSKSQMKSTFESLLKRNPGKSPDEIAQLIATGQINFGAEKKETTVAAGKAGQIAVAANEVQQFAPLVLQASANVPRGNFVPFGKLKQMADTSISDPNLMQFKVQMTALNNAYESLAARGGTDKDKRAHIHELFDTANSQEAVQALIGAIQQEGAAAEQAARDATKRREPDHAATAVPADIAALLQKHGGK